MAGTDSLMDTMKDMTFSKFITTRIVSWLYIIGIVLSCLCGLMMIVRGIGTLQWSGLMGFLTIILSPVATVLMIVATRVWLEIVVVVFKIAESTEKMAK